MGARDGQHGLELNVSRWGNSLAVRLPAALARELGVGEGDTLHLHSDETGAWRLSPSVPRPKLAREELIRRMRAHQAMMPRTESVMREMRDGARY